jgi:plasmid stabilization system protein ParE
VRRVEIRPEAVAEIDETAFWYGRQQRHLRDDFLAAVADAVTMIAENPQQFRILHRDTRRVFLRRFPFGLYFRVTRDRILIVALLHARRDPRAWQVRETIVAYTAARAA